MIAGGSNDLIQTNPSTGGFSGTDTITGPRPMLGALGLYGGPTATIPLLIGSPAIAAGLVAPGGCPPISGAWRGRSTAAPGPRPRISGRSRCRTTSSRRRSDDATAPAGSTSFRDAVNAANAGGSGLVSFAPGLSGTVRCSAVGDTTVGPTALAITGSVEIDGPVLADGGLTIAPAPRRRRCGCSTWRRAPA